MDQCYSFFERAIILRNSCEFTDQAPRGKSPNPKNSTTLTASRQNLKKNECPYGILNKIYLQNFLRDGGNFLD